ncbi:Uncharacterised protein [Yersinia intermedia]|nr:Uncharacterised protein [Yersinia intermedia]
MTERFLILLREMNSKHTFCVEYITIKNQYYSLVCYQHHFVDFGTHYDSILFQMIV